MVSILDIHKNCPNGQDEEDCPGFAAGQSGKYTGHTHVRTVRTVKTRRTVLGLPRVRVVSILDIHM